MSFQPTTASSTVSDRSGPPQHDIVVLGASAGGADAVTSVLRQLRYDVPAAFFVVCHQLPNSEGHLVHILNAAGPLPAKQAADGDEIRHGIVYVAPPDRHLLVKQGVVRVTRGPRENRWRPAIDPLFRSAAVAYGPRVIGVVLTGMLDDGTAGLAAIKRCGGVAIVQDPDDAAYPDMPQSALANVQIDYRVPIAEMGAVIERLVVQPAPPDGTAPRDLQIEARIAESGYSDETLTDQLGTLTPLSCPECSGPLWRQAESAAVRYRCRVGHAYSAASLLSAEEEALEAALWAAVRMFDQRANVLNTMAEQDRQAQRVRMVEHHQTLADEARRHAKVLRKIILRQEAD